jgi:hypothetical protein
MQSYDRPVLIDKELYAINIARLVPRDLSKWVCCEDIRTFSGSRTRYRNGQTKGINITEQIDAVI